MAILRGFTPFSKPPKLHHFSQSRVLIFVKSLISVHKSISRGSSIIHNAIRPSSISKAATFAFPETENKVRLSEELCKETEETLEWPSICAQVSSFASTAAGRAACQRSGLPSGQDRAESQKLLDQTAAAALLPQALDFSGIEDVSDIVRLAVAGELLTVRELCTVQRSLQAARRVLQDLERIGESSDRFTPLLEILQDCDFMTELVENIGYCIDCTLSIILDRASATLESVRLERKENMEKLDTLLKEVSVSVYQAGGIDSPLITKRRSRMCVGIKASHKSLLPGGVVLSVSSSGATYFMEPRDAIELNNMEVRLSNAERTEELAVLGFLTAEVAGSETRIRCLMEKILELDFACARGAYAKWMNGVCPAFIEDFEKIDSERDGNNLLVDIEGIQHPLLLEPFLRSLSPVPKQQAGAAKMLSQSDQAMNSGKVFEGKAPVPLDIKVQNTKKVVVISGPNTGGKTATMKTLGLAAIMSKAGLFLPARNTPRLPWFDQILADIGDHQSLEHSLSTFSAHISCICKILEAASEKSLVLIDEIGCGTDPSEGVALSTSILQHLAGCVSLAMVTTHYADLSLLKATDSRFENAAMEFCMDTLQPTYHILWGSTGNSNALSIAKSIGFDQEVLDRAQQWVQRLLPDKQKERQGLLYQSLLEERNCLEAQAKEAASILSEVKKLHFEINSEAEDLDNREAALKAKETKSIQQELRSVSSRMDDIIKKFEKQLENANPDQFNSIMRVAEAAIASIVASHSASGSMLTEETEYHSTYMPQVGDKVYVKGLGDKLATVIETLAEDGTAMVQYGKIRIRAKRNDMKPVNNVKDIFNRSIPPLKEQRRFAQRVIVAENKDDDSTFGPAVRTSKNTVDLRGMRVDEAALRLQMAISECKSYGVLFVVHGMGTGAVKERTLDILRSHPRVAKFEEENPMNYGCTIAYIK
ncbi:Endonuclease MutS2 protein [Dioscorea alata]|uniref:Endonuclease MutS2 protein n=1 Tax=Dioscorea alata TaxID=55571 RepID=A0ACB7WT58_DIOAL|nr:Endonuclease MutS2 protein [Dioscorea alata]